MTDWIGAAEAARRIGIKPASLYAYVSRGVLTRRREPDGRASLFDADEIADFARRTRPRLTAAAPTELVIESELTELTLDTQRYRGYAATELAKANSRFEDVAMLLWTGELPVTLDDEMEAVDHWEGNPSALEVGRAAQAALPAGTLPLERLQVIVPALAAADTLRLHLDRPAVVAAGKSLIADMTDALPTASADLACAADAPNRVAARLASRLCPHPSSDALIGVINAALVLVADHEMAASTLAARVAASMGADPYAVVSTGLGAMGGALHGGGALGAEVMLASASSLADAPRVVGGVLRRGEKLSGFGHVMYSGGDPRAKLLLQLVGEYAPQSPRWAIACALTQEARRRALPEPNVEFALAVLADVSGMVRGAGEAMFAIGRTAGWLAHAIEEYVRSVPIRRRCTYAGPAARGVR